jgi:hypothetical protein
LDLIFFFSCPKAAETLRIKNVINTEFKEILTGGKGTRHMGERQV